MKKPRANSKIRFLVKQLLKEIEKKGYTLKQTDACYGVDICIRFDDELKLNNILGNWELKCGKYTPVRLDSDGIKNAEVSE